MIRRGLRVLLTAAGLWASLPGLALAEVILSDAEIARLSAFGPWPPVVERDPSNRFSGDPQAIALGQALFNDPILSSDGLLSCASCHDPEGGFTRPVARGMGRVLLDRNIPTVRDLAGLRWFGWGGRSDALWAASLHPIVDATEMAHAPEALKESLQSSPYAEGLEQLLGPLQGLTGEAVLVAIAKLLAAYQETLVSAPTPFDQFRLDLQQGQAGSYPLAAQRGLKIFLGRGNCSFCHVGARFTNNAFHDAGVPYFLSETRVDPGRHQGLQRLVSSPYTLDSKWSDDPTRAGAWALRSVRQRHSDFGSFRTPTLRGLIETAPYMHDGSLPTLEAVVRHYSEINTERLHADGEAILAPLHLSEGEVADLVAFLQTLSGPDR